uniref:Uncharacterized protein n=1 Tax=Kryptolebias marmoratus TaxID=37003 RepID=A0A3Q2ZDP8_KRYMA
MLRTHSSSLAMSVSSSHGFTSNRSEDLAMRVGSKVRGRGRPHLLIRAKQVDVIVILVVFGGSRGGACRFLHTWKT